MVVRGLNGGRVELPRGVSCRVGSGSSGDGSLAALAAFGLGVLGLGFKVSSGRSCRSHEMQVLMVCGVLVSLFMTLASKNGTDRQRQNII